MPRLVPNSASGPIEIKPQKESVWICACGLSQNHPHCDGSHNTARKNEPAGKVCVYDSTRTRIVEVRDEK